MEFFGYGLVIGITWLLVFSFAGYGDYYYNYCNYVYGATEQSCNSTPGKALYVVEIIAAVLIFCSG